MEQPAPKEIRKSSIKPVTITATTKFNPEIFERALQRRQQENGQEINLPKSATGLNQWGLIFVYIFLVICFLIGGGGIALCGVYFNTSQSTQNWKIGGIVLGFVTCVAAIILIVLNIFKQKRDRPWRSKKEETLFSGEDFYIDDNDQIHIKDFRDNETQNHLIIHEDPKEERNSLHENKRETASSPIPNSSYEPLKTHKSDLIFCPGCNRVHSSSHQCMYSTRIPNSFSTPIPTVSQLATQDSIAIQTEETSEKKKKKHTIIDRALKYSTTIDTQTDVAATNVTESIILRRVPIPTSKVIVQQPTTKILIVKVPNVAGQLIIQPKEKPTDKK